MANNFSGDSSCVAVWNFEDTPDSFLEDSKGSNDLTNDGVDEDTTNYKVGSQAATFILANADNFTLSDANQDAGFPFRYDDTTSMEKSFTMCCWINPDVITSTDYFFSKYDAGGNNRVFAIALNSTGDVFKFNLGWDSGGEYDAYDHTGTVTVARWYHVAFSYDAVSLEYRMRVWDDNGSALLANDKTGIVDHAIEACDTPLIIGTRDGGAGAFDGHLDEMVVFNRVLSVYEIDQIRAGTFDGTGALVNDFSNDGNCVALFNFDAASIVADSKGLNTLTNDGVDADTDFKKQGDQSGSWVRANTDKMTLAPEDMSLDFPWNYDAGASIEKTFSVCFWMRMNSAPVANDESCYMFSIYDIAGDLRVMFVYVSVTNDKLFFGMGHTNGEGYEANTEFDTALVIDTWYHVGVTYDSSDKSYRVRIWNDATGTILEADSTGTMTNATDARDLGLTLGARNDGEKEFDGNLDEMVFFKKVLTAADIDEIRNGLYDTSTGSTYSLISTVAAVTTLDAVTLNVNRQLISSIVNATTVSSIDVLFIVKFISTIVMSTTVSSVDVLKILNFISTIAEEVSVSGIDLNVERLLVATTELVTTLGDIDLPIERLLESAVANVTTASSIDLLRINNFISTITNTTTLSSINVGITFLLISTIAMVTTLDPITVVQVLIDGIASSGVVDKTYLYKALGVFADAYVVRDYSYNEHVVNKSYVYTIKNATI